MLQAVNTAFVGEVEVEDSFIASNRVVKRLRPIEMRGEKAYFRPELMATDFPYPFEFMGVNLVAVKRDDGSVDFYHIP